MRFHRGHAQVVKASNADDRPHASRRFGAKRQRQLRAGVFADERHAVWIDAELDGVTPHELDSRTQVVDGVGESRQALKAVVHRKPVVAGLGQKLEKLSGEGAAAARVPVAAVNDDDGRAAIPGLLNVRIQCQRDPVDTAVHDVAADARDDVVAIEIANLDRQALSRRGAFQRRHEDPRGDAARQDPAHG